MRYWIAFIIAVALLIAPLKADDKKPRDEKDKKETPKDEPENKLDKAKDRLKEKGKDKDDNSYHSDGEADIFDYVNIAEFIIDYYPENLEYTYSPYPFYDKGLFQRSKAANRPVYLETGISAFTGFNNITATGVNTKLKLFTFIGLEYNYCGLNQKTRYFDSELKIHRFGPVLNLVTCPYGLLELKLGYTKIIDVGGGPMFGLEATVAPVYPLIFRGNMHLSSINNNGVSDSFIGLGFVLRPLEFYGGYRAFSFAGENIGGPTGGMVFRF
jgi:hypothetical protein